MSLSEAKRRKAANRYVTLEDIASGRAVLDRQQVDAEILQGPQHEDVDTLSQSPQQQQRDSYCTARGEGEGDEFGSKAHFVRRMESAAPEGTNVVNQLWETTGRETFPVLEPDNAEMRHMLLNYTVGINTVEESTPYPCLYCDFKIKGRPMKFPTKLVGTTFTVQIGQFHPPCVKTWWRERNESNYRDGMILINRFGATFLGISMCDIGFAPDKRRIKGRTAQGTLTEEEFLSYNMKEVSWPVEDMSWVPVPYLYHIHDRAVRDAATSSSMDDEQQTQAALANIPNPPHDSSVRVDAQGKWHDEHALSDRLSSTTTMVSSNARFMVSPWNTSCSIANLSTQ